VFRDGVAIGVQTSALTLTDTPPAGTHRYQVRAVDAAKSRSALSASITVVVSP
jgi:hypothetical protein